MPTTVAAGGAMVNFNAQGLFVKGKNGTVTELLDLTTSASTLWTSSNPAVLVPPASFAQGGTYMGGAPGCACVLASNSSVGSQPTNVGVSTPVGTCPPCAPVIVTPGGSSSEATTSPTVADPSATQPVHSAGVLMWSFDAGADLAGQIAVGADNSAYFITRDGVLHGLDSSGKEILHRQAAGNSPVVTTGGVVIAKASETGLAAFGADGAAQWQVEIGAGAGPLAASNGVIYASAGSDLLAVTDTGSIKWRVGVGAISTAVATSDGVAGAVTGGDIASLASDGALLWTFAPAEGFSGGLAFGDDAVYAGSRSGTVYAIDERTGKPLWTVVTPHAVVAGPALGAAGAIYFGSEAVHGVASNGQLRWTQAAIKPDAAAISAGILDGVFDAGADNLAAMLGSDGNFIWTSRSFGAVAASAIAPNGTLYVGSSAGRIFAVR
ncbi:MAG TPA: PQQ-binding-like beta-propeller repeat protein [Candidatus Acidoferrales bacterium]|nr:PQQ-binding-like beta-propeller repeat protein [Candidatus Acidoferrales bacterium]